MMSSAYLNRVQTRVSKIIPNFCERISPFYSSPRGNENDIISEEGCESMHTDSEYEETDLEEFDETQYTTLTEKRDALIKEA